MSLGPTNQALGTPRLPQAYISETDSESCKELLDKPLEGGDVNQCNSSGADLAMNEPGQHQGLPPLPTSFSSGHSHSIPQNAEWTSSESPQYPDVREWWDPETLPGLPSLPLASTSPISSLASPPSISTISSGAWSDDDDVDEVKPSARHSLLVQEALKRIQSEESGSEETKDGMGAVQDENSYFDYYRSPSPTSPPSIRQTTIEENRLDGMIERQVMSDAQCLPPSSPLDCPLCGSLLRQPITLACGWSVCHPCLIASSKDSSFPCYLTRPCPFSIRPRTYVATTSTIDSEYHSDQACWYTEHLVADEALDVVLNNVTSLARAVPREVWQATLGVGEEQGLEDKVMILRSQLAMELECGICYRLLSTPTTTACGHTFCEECLSRSLDHAPRCPSCRAPSPPLTHPRPTLSRALRILLIKVFPPSLLGQDRASADQSGSEEDAADEYVPIFVGSLIMPDQECMLHIFEARYRLMMQRCMAHPNGLQAFGMCVPGTGPNRSHGDYGTWMTIRWVQCLTDGRMIVSAKAGLPFRIISRGIRDRYHTAIIRPLVPGDKDIGVMEEDPMDPLALTKDQGYCYAVRLVSFLNKYFTHPQILEAYGPIPSEEDVESLVWWAAAVLPVSDQQKYPLLMMSRLRNRLSLVTHWSHTLENAWSLPVPTEVIQD
ncbi:hypothetical protein BJ684DRAFT_14912 [Piptocephalis cylindrospora]|uniref:RING-type domain-containing protein n=1 Tax=Piptocephalis cylindrospora TaxID=1907219 RepID=A0A4P9Y6T1_9FUNG|nr:hypothetical protein BJ684DRAFT_14912 [Piptocephalis cylindrospora]|eukprot:RKP14777.1 hypothetical protein BJ684DRAFT_14912 [Piptocephalis cylindrospora]